LLQNNKTLQTNFDKLSQEFSEINNKNPENSKVENNIDKQSIIDEVTLNLEKRFSLEKSEMLKKHEEIIKNIKDEKDKIIEELKLKIDKKSINIKKDKENKFINSIKIYEEINSKTREYISSYTYRQINDFNNLRNIVIEEYKKEDYDVVIDYMLKYISNKKSKWYFIRKIKRCLYLYDTYKDKLKIFNFSISFLSNLSDDDWYSWINLLNNIIDEKFDKNNEENIEEDVEEELDYDCKNENCVDYVKIKNTYCESCIKHVRNCINCGYDFSDDSDIKKCFNCRDFDED
jgi:hypothetical protein